MSPSKRRGLGRGLDALLATPSDPQIPPESANESVVESNTNEFNQPINELQTLALELLQPGKYQPRKDMSPDALDELADSIRTQGIIQPIVVRKIADAQYEIIAGERRWRAAKLAGLTEISCLVKEIADESAVAIALIENIQREDLNAMEEAVALERLMNEFQLTHQEVAEAIGKSRTTVSNLLRLNKLNDDVKTLLERGDIEMGHARALLTLDEQLQTEVARTVAAKELTVRETENLVKKVLAPQTTVEEKPKDKNAEIMAKSLTDKIGAAVAISHNKKGKGKMVISYDTLDELDTIVARFRSF